jgi:DNA-binding NtrC family response regulator
VAAAQGNGAGGVTSIPLPIEETYHIARERLLAEFERRYLTWLVTQAGNNISRAARIADVDRTTLYRLMERHGLQRILASNPEGTEHALQEDNVT